MQVSASNSNVNDKSLLLATVLAVILTVAIAATLYFGAVRHLAKDPVQVGLTNIATIGGIVSGLSLSGTAVLSLSGRYVEQLQRTHGGAIRLVLFGGFSFVVALSLACAMAAMWSDSTWARILLSAAAPSILCVLVSSALLINSAFKWKEHGTPPSLSPAPIGADPAPFSQAAEGPADGAPDAV